MLCPNLGLARITLKRNFYYSWEEKGELRHPSDQHASDMVGWTIDDFASAGPFMRLLSRALAGTSSPSSDRLRFVWDRVAFTNYVTGTVGVGARTRPSEAMWAKAERRFLDVLLPQLAPRRIIVLGKTMWGYMPETALVLTDDVQGYRNRDGSIAMAWAVNHPSRGLSWAGLATIVQFACERELKG